jgi:hypothetical protein
MRECLRSAGKQSGVALRLPPQSKKVLQKGWWNNSRGELAKATLDKPSGTIAERALGAKHLRFALCDRQRLE